jgi:anti-anti-sigma factor
VRPLEEPIAADRAGPRAEPLDESGLLGARILEHRDRAEVALHGELDAASAPGLRRLMTDLGASGSPVVLDLSALDFVDLAGLRAVASCCEQGAGRLEVCGVSPFLARVVRLAGLAESLGLDQSAPAPRSG